MIISDLNHVEVVSEETETSIEGGYYYPYYYGSYSSAGAGAGATAYGPELLHTHPPAQLPAWLCWLLQQFGFEY
jgi:hypothetical protein